MKQIQPEKWNNVAIPVVDAINILKNEILLFNSQLGKHHKFMTDLEATDMGHYNLNVNNINTNKKYHETQIKLLEKWAKDEFKIHWEKTRDEIHKTVESHVAR